VSPISPIGHDAPTLAALSHQGTRFKKITTKHSKVTTSATAATLVKAFEVTTPLALIYADFKSY
jgi:hypothetical protein